MQFKIATSLLLQVVISFMINCANAMESTWLKFEPRLIAFAQKLSNYFGQQN
jgi:hypothetical protein